VLELEILSLLLFEPEAKEPVPSWLGFMIDYVILEVAPV
jgi:hypothetical protein